MSSLNGEALLLEAKIGRLRERIALQRMIQAHEAHDRQLAKLSAIVVADLERELQGHKLRLINITTG